MSIDVYICGCSFSTGFYKSGYEKSTNKLIPGYNEPYTELFCRIKKLSYKNIAFNGASNYAICKQIEYAITQNPKLILINFTTPWRMDWTDPDTRLTHVPTLADIVYNDKPHVIPEARHHIRSLPISSYMYSKNIDPIVVNYVAEYVDPVLQADKDKLLITGMLSILEKTKIPYIIVNFAEEIAIPSVPDLDNISWRYISKEFPVDTDPAHFNQAGHVYLSRKIIASSIGI